MLKFLSGAKILPTKDQMTVDIYNQIQHCMTKDFPINKFHALKMGRDEYYTDLAKTADIPNIPEEVFSHPW